MALLRRGGTEGGALPGTLMWTGAKRRGPTGALVGAPLPTHMRAPITLTAVAGNGRGAPQEERGGAPGVGRGPPLQGTRTPGGSPTFAIEIAVPPPRRAEGPRGLPPSQMMLQGPLPHAGALMVTRRRGPATMGALMRGAAGIAATARAKGLRGSRGPEGEGTPPQGLPLPSIGGGPPMKGAPTETHIIDPDPHGPALLSTESLGACRAQHPGGPLLPLL